MPKALTPSSSWHRIRRVPTPVTQLAPASAAAAHRKNAYYVNGFPVTNPLTQLGASELPFGAISQAQVLTGGFGAEFGRSVGGVVNITTKSGTNNWEMGAQVSIAPSSTRAKAKDIFYPNTGAPEKCENRQHPVQKK
ncbi:hypothetical protein ACFS07_09140 [Undibacterium arcticum]